MILNIDDLLRFFKHRKISYASFSIECGWSKTYMSMIMNGYISLNENNSKIILDVFEKYGYNMFSDDSRR
jgi:cyanate lyase